MSDVTVKRSKQESVSAHTSLLGRFWTKQGERLIPWLSPSDLFGCGIGATCRAFGEMVKNEKVWKNACLSLWPKLLSVHISHTKVGVFREFYRATIIPAERCVVAEDILQRMVLRSACALRYIRVTDMADFDINDFHALLPGNSRENIDIADADCEREFEQYGVDANQIVVFSRMMFAYLRDANDLQIMSGPMSRVMLTRGVMNGLHYYWVKMIAQTSLKIAKSERLLYVPWFVHANSDGRINGMKVGIISTFE
jgi:hypothetical protein